ncbi:T9SS type A sorting domain-containing protein [Natronomonas gomsonensis]|nr:T9SS type A sorting domain-containing protein [Natronomonas gomsonensis]
MVLSIVGGSIAFTGAAAAAQGDNADSIDLSSSSVSSSSEQVWVNVSISATGKDVIYATDYNNNGDIDDGEVFAVITDGGSADMDNSDGEVAIQVSANSAGFQATSADILVEGEDGSDSENGEVDLAYPFTADASATLSITGTATRDQTAVYSAPATVFLGEEGVNVGPAEGTGGSVTFSGIAGAADGDVIIADDANNVDFTSNNGFSTGGYSTGDPSDEVDYSVRTPQVNNVSLYMGAGKLGADVTDGLVTTDTDTVTISPQFNFQSADRLEIIVTDGDDLDISGDTVSGSPNVVEEDGDYYYTGPTDGEFWVDISDYDTGNYTVEVAGDELSSASNDADFEITNSETTIELEHNSVVKGESVVATATGTPGENVIVRVDNDALADTMPNGSVVSAADLYANTGDVVIRVHNNIADITYAELSLGDDGVAQTRIKTGALEAGSTATFEVATFPDADAEDDVDLEVFEQSISIDDARKTVAAGSDFTMNGTAPEASEVAAYVKIDDTWYLIPGSTNPDTSLDSDDYELELTASDELNIPGSYRVGVAAWPSSGNADAQLTNDEWTNLETTTSTLIRSVEGNLSAQISRNRIAVASNDEVTLSGLAVGQTDVVYYVVGPRGDVMTSNLSVDEQEFSRDIGGFDRRGVHEIVVVGTGRDGGYETPPSTVVSQVGSSATQEQAIEVIKDRHSGAGVDDVWVQTNLTAESARVTLEAADRLGQEEVTISGTSNRQPDTVYFIEMADDNGNIVASGESEVNANGTWNLTLDLSEVETGMYTLSVEGDEASAMQRVEVAESVTTETPTATPEPTATAESTLTATAESTSTAPGAAGTDEPTETTSEDQPGFGAVIVLIALLGAALLAARRNAF